MAQIYRSGYASDLIAVLRNDSLGLFRGDLEQATFRGAAPAFSGGAGNGLTGLDPPASDLSLIGCHAG